MGFTMLKSPRLSCLIVLMLAAPMAMAQDKAIDKPLPTSGAPHVDPAYGAGYEHRQGQERAHRDLYTPSAAVAQHPGGQFSKHEATRQRPPGARAAGKGRGSRGGQGRGGGGKK
jgi:hypothetical protein